VGKQSVVEQVGREATDVGLAAPLQSDLADMTAYQCTVERPFDAAAALGQPTVTLSRRDHAAPQAAGWGPPATTANQSISREGQP
jgi:hypothetical protein